MKPVAVITGGGTAGHTNPGIAVAQALVDRGLDPAAVRFVGGQRGNEGTLVPAAGFEIDLLAGRGIQRRLTLANVGAVAALLTGLVQGFWLVLRHRPKVVLCLGGYAAFAVSLAAVVLRVPVVVTEQNARASAVNRFIGRFARTCALPFPGTDLPHGVLTGNPSLAAVVTSVQGGDVGAARRRLGLPEDRVVVAVWSGSLGATRVNTVTRELAQRWAHRSDVALRHVVGRRDWATFGTPPPELVGSTGSAGATEPTGVPGPAAAGSLVYQLVEYEDQMPSLLVAADVAVCRAGASTVAEISIAGLPSVLVPLPHAPRDHQRANTEELVAAGGAVVVADADLDVDRLESILGPLVADVGRRRQMAAAAASVARPDAADQVAGLVLGAAGLDLSPAGSVDDPPQGGPDA